MVISVKKMVASVNFRRTLRSDGAIHCGHTKADLVRNKIRMFRYGNKMADRKVSMD